MKVVGWLVSPPRSLATPTGHRSSPRHDKQHPCSRRAARVKPGRERCVMHHDPNPFDESADENPFSNGGRGGARGGGGKWQFSFGFGGGGGGGSKGGATVGFEGHGKELLQWEADLKRREADIKRREEALKSAGVPPEDKNWPPFFPIIHHDIANEIPANAQKLQYLVFVSWLGIVLCLFWNFIAVIVCWIRGGDSKLFFLATIYGMLGIPLSYLMWYRPLYRAMRTDSAFSFGWFFLCYMLHIAFCVFAAIAPPVIFRGKSLTGILAAIDTFSDHAIVGIFYFVGFALFCLETLVTCEHLGSSESIHVFQRTQVKWAMEEILQKPTSHQYYLFLLQFCAYMRGPIGDVRRERKLNSHHSLNLLLSLLLIKPQSKGLKGRRRAASSSREKGQRQLAKMAISSLHATTSLHSPCTTNTSFRQNQVILFTTRSSRRGSTRHGGARTCFQVSCSADKPVVIGLAADSGCGKSTFMRRLTSVFGGAAEPPKGGNPDSNTLISDTTTVICLDDYHSLDRTGRKEKGVTALDPRANDFDLMYEQVKAIKEGKAIDKPIYNHVTGLLDPPELIQPPKIFVIEGLHPMFDERVRELLDFSIYLDISDEVKFAWKIQRDMAERGHSLESIQASIEARKPDFDAFIDPQKQFADAVIEVLPTQLIPDDNEGKVLRVKLIMKEGVTNFNPVYLFDEGSSITWVPCGRKLTCSYPGIKFAYGPDSYFGNEVSVLEMDGQFDRLDELIYVESHLSNLSTKFYGEVTQQMLKHADFPGSNNGTGLFQTIVGLKIRDLYEQIIAERAGAPAEAAKV
ncbi:hypothetical protein GUJ93_ZPchr0002g23689 [Zizania palustris]|uniref:Secretory carrier-associated membrane protein n=1 Tax=Zizania palustris TaxID=103762 RepID=A0A8J5RHK2_ZIZPA|nr:hypothetical protein GUJ93_ZPchr0002g23689 [Zizania palustris]